jgi:zinc carboxypeptidase
MMRSMIDVVTALESVPPLTQFCSVEKLHAFVETLRAKACGAHVEIAGRSAGGLPIHHVRFGNGRVKALILGGPHAHEPIGSATVFGLMTLLQQGNRALLDADVEWHVVPCIDPDGARLNEGWSQKPFSLESYMRNFYVQAHRDQVDGSFPVTYKKLSWSQPSQEAKVLKSLLDAIRPDFFYSLHNTRTGGAFYFLTRDIGTKYHRELYDLLRRYDVPLQKRPIWREVCAPFAESIVEMYSIRKHYDYLEKTVPNPEQDEYVRYGAGSWEYLAEIHPSAQSFVAEIGYARHPSDESEKIVGGNLRQTKLRVDADSKFLASLLLDEWDRVQEDVDRTNPFYRAIVGGGSVLPKKESLVEGGSPLSLYPTRDALFKAKYDRPMTEADLFDAYIVSGGYMFLRLSYQFVRLLKASPQTSTIRRAIQRLEPAFDEALREIGRHVDLNAFQVMDCRTLAQVQLGSGLIVLNSILEGRSPNE